MPGVTPDKTELYILELGWAVINKKLPAEKVMGVGLLRRAVIARSSDCKRFSRHDIYRLGNRHSLGRSNEPKHCCLLSVKQHVLQARECARRLILPSFLMSNSKQQQQPGPLLQFLDALKCAGVAVESLRLGKAGNAMDVDGEESALSCPAVDLLWLYWNDIEHMESSGTITKVQLPLQS